jgi:hypothetical protein
MTRATRTTFLSALLVSALSAAIGGASSAPGSRTPRVAPDPNPAIARGAYLVRAMGCNHCHTPFKMGPNGPEPDMSRELSGHPEALTMPPAPKLPEGPWVWTAAGTTTACAGPWGVSFTANLTPDPETGLGRWTPETFIATMRTGRHEGKGRHLLPPMPFENIAALNDDDVRALFAYLQSLKPLRNRVPAPIDPPEAGQ